MNVFTPRGQPQTAQMAYAAPPGTVFAAPPMTAVFEQPVTYAAPATTTVVEQVYASPPTTIMQEPVVMEQQQLVIVEQPQMVYAVAPQPQPQLQLSVRANPNNLFQGTRLRSEGPIAREELIRQMRLFEGEMEAPPVLIPGQFINLAQLQAQHPQMLKELIMEQPVAVAAGAPAVYMEVPPVTVIEESLVNGVPQTTVQYVVEEPTVQYATGPAGSVMVGEVLTAQPMQLGQPTVQYAVAPAGSVMVEEVLAAQQAPGSGVVLMDPWGPPDLSNPMTKTGTMVMMAPDQGHLITAAPAQQQTVLSGKRGTVTNALFDLLDSNADGKISRSEFRRGLKGEIIQVGQVANIPMR